MSEMTASAPAAQTKKKPGILGGAMIVAGTSIGAGMFALPVYSAGMWFAVSMAMMALVWFCAYSSSLYLTEASLNYKDGASYATIAEDTLGKVGKILATGTVAFVCFILTYAYISGGSSVVGQTLGNTLGLQLGHSGSALLFTLVLATVVIAGSRAVDRVATIMLGGMALTFFGSTSMLAGNASVDTLFPGIGLAEPLPYLWIAIPVLVTSFGFHGTVPSLVKHYQKDARRTRLALLVGTMLTMLVYVVWQLAIMGNVPRDQFSEVIAQGGNVATLISAVGQSTDVSGVEAALMLFGNLALASSFIGVALGLQDLIKDLLKLSDSLVDSAKAAAITFLPALLLCMAMPHGFITAIGFAALAASVFVLVLPALMARVLRQRKIDNGFQTSGGMLRLNFVLGFGVLAVLVEIVHLMGLLPKFG
ncbi:amino acid permease [Ferrimonas marina]|uniref:Aromatic amino acid permease n=1 Tax=Ferrimonas marina TaxID=299255 RepID=A0A1M5ZTJ0_9GAMM|nr:aromatic amino acid transport family protein [Ferrimonas marina]SHI27560.1 tryptophan-specific transport protein [Ferrimonas marina]